MSEPDENPFGLPDDVLRMLHGSGSEEVGCGCDMPCCQPITSLWTPEQQHEVDVHNYAYSVRHYPGPFGWGEGEDTRIEEAIHQDELRERMRRYTFSVAEEMICGPFPRPYTRESEREYIAAYNAFEACWNAAGKVQE